MRTNSVRPTKLPGCNCPAITEVCRELRLLAALEACTCPMKEVAILRSDFIGLHPVGENCPDQKETNNRKNSRSAALTAPDSEEISCQQHVVAQGVLRAPQTKSDSSSARRKYHVPLGINCQLIDDHNQLKRKSIPLPLI